MNKIVYIGESTTYVTKKKFMIYLLKIQNNIY